MSPRGEEVEKRRILSSSILEYVSMGIKAKWHAELPMVEKRGLTGGPGGALVSSEPGQVGMSGLRKRGKKARGKVAGDILVRIEIVEDVDGHCLQLCAADGGNLDGTQLVNELTDGVKVLGVGGAPRVGQRAFELAPLRIKKDEAALFQGWTGREKESSRRPEYTIIILVVENAVDQV
ncbi:hypothetical protein CMQ_8031 [Grosmannia clavigera kw1407]|uniref:Uncharacterized protein n=1 Tax=Grosmannia clavigera (strain kw1407 / UAMH 11150) TaxID=655863 RepID=F0XKT2_GROCL|nr:uncharacterized protein CMQ_8031 [Grosmannia clavigera kw1407]EFX01565.1 hypothetical protein CMQ_8031 [Grosmannia clavigera kw1407]